MAESHKLDLVHAAIRAGILGHIQWKDSAAQLIRDDPDLCGMITPDEIRAVLRKFVLAGSTLDVRKETREEYLDENPEHPYWYRAIVPVPGIPSGLFLELILIDDDPDEPWVEIVSAHCQQS